MHPTDTAAVTRKEALRLLALAGGGLFSAALVPAASAEEAPVDHSAMGGMMMAPDDDPSTAAYRKAAARMHAAMDIAYTGDPDIDFARGMIAHHQGAIDMAKVVIEYGSDPDMRALAEGVVSAQEKEIAFMQQWLATHGG